ncbi:sigma 54-interacting transcriptional regulator [Neobacillus sp. NRS-1170]|uniref:sigma 54-interacting transcriptional regulator n=1 Tax=Neobacillus sp. NRS-1170 TaxID=3233898 RepID=UPI003D2D4365
MYTRIKNLMQKPIIFSETDQLEYIIRQFDQQQLSGALIFNENELMGTISEKEIIRGAAAGKEQAFEVMCPISFIFNEEDLVDFNLKLTNNIFPVENEKNEITGIITYTQYIEECLKNSKYTLDQLDAIFNSAHSGILSIDNKGYITSINPVAEKMAGTTKEKAIGRFISDIVVPTGLLNVIQEGKPTAEKYQVGNRKYISNRTPIKRDGKVVGAVGVFQDISEIEFISQELNTVRDLLDELDIVLESSYDAIIIVDEQGKIIKSNEALNRIIGIVKMPNYYQELVGDYLEKCIVTAVSEERQRVTQMETNKKKGNLLVITGSPVRKKGMESKIVINIRDVSEMDGLRKELKDAKQHLKMLMGKQETETNFVAFSPIMRKLSHDIKQIATVDSTILLLGESGVGKEVVSRLIHQSSSRKEQPFVKVNCGAIPETLVESELFGYESGAFTGADRKGKLGLFEQAHQGTIFLDEIGELPLSIQVKLLRVLQEREFTRVGGIKQKKIDVRIIAATNQDLRNLVEQKQFRSDLYYRLNVVPIHIPSLKERIEDIPFLIAHFQELFSRKYKRDKQFSEEAVHLLTHYHWPGNVRELSNVVERLMVTTSGAIIHKEGVAQLLYKENRGNEGTMIYVNGIMPLSDAVLEVEKQLITQALKIYKNTRNSAKALRVNQSTIVRKMKKFSEDEKLNENRV